MDEPGGPRAADAGGAFQGVVYVAVRTAYFENMYSGLVRDPADAIGLVRTDGALIARGPAVAKSMTLPPDSGLMTAIRARPESGQFESRAVLDNVERIYAYQKVGEYPLYISVARAKSGLWAEWRERIVPYLALCMAASVLLLVTAWLARRHYLNELAAVRRLGEEAALRARAEAEHASLQRDSRSKDEFLAGLSHELRNPLHAILGIAQILGRSTLDGTQSRHVQTLRECGDALLLNPLTNKGTAFTMAERHELGLDGPPLARPVEVHEMETAGSRGHPSSRGRHRVVPVRRDAVVGALAEPHDGAAEDAGAQHAGERAAQRGLDALGHRGEVGLAVERRENGAAHESRAAHARQDRAGKPLRRDAAAIDHAAIAAVHRKRGLVAEIHDLGFHTRAVRARQPTVIQSSSPARAVLLPQFPG